MRTKKPKSPVASAMFDGHDLFVMLNGIKIAKRGHPGTPYARRWISLEPGYAVYQSADYSQIVIEVEPTSIS
jgi:hypothetical protein